MLKLFKYKQADDFFSYIKSGGSDLNSVMPMVIEIINEVKLNGNNALINFNKEFDNVDLKQSELTVTESEIKNAVVSKDFKKAVDVAIENITFFHKHQKNSDFDVTGKYNEQLSQKITPMDRAGIYIPGGKSGKTPLVSSLLMNAIPAKIAGVKEIIAVTPPNVNKTISSELLYTMGILGITKIFKVGGAQAIAALAYGTETIPAVDVIVGPGNVYVTCAKKMVFGDVMIDGIFGHSEISIISDGTTPPEYIAADLISQAEHAGDELSLLITTSYDFISKVTKQIELQLESSCRKEIALKSLESRGAVMLVDNLEQAVEISNKIAPEHLELHVSDNEKLLKMITHAGAIFVGEMSAEPIGDYICGTNHVLPTNGSARFSSPLGVYTFEKRSNIIRYNKGAFDAYSPYAAVLAETEGLCGHKHSLTIRNEI